jgi:hypothetical protein
MGGMPIPLPGLAHPEALKREFQTGELRCAQFWHLLAGSANILNRQETASHSP